MNNSEKTIIALAGMLKEAYEDVATYKKLWLDEMTKKEPTPAELTTSMFIGMKNEGENV